MNQSVSRSAARRARERERRYKTILAAAESLFAAEGFQGASIERIADRAEVSVGTVYFYFKNKEDLLVHLLAEIGFSIRELVGSEFRKAEPSLEGFERAGMSFFSEFCVNHPQKLAIFFRESVGKGQAVESQRKKIFDKFAADIQDALKRMAHSLNASFAGPLSVEVMAVSIVGMYERLAYQYLIWQDRADELGQVSRHALSFIRGGVENLMGSAGK